MHSRERRHAILDRLHTSKTPVSATALASALGTSRQTIVSDVAILRAAGEEIMATPRGYVILPAWGTLTFQIACRHTATEMEAELNAIVDQGCTVQDVIVEHPVYGQLTAALQLSSRSDVHQFIQLCADVSARPLSILTEGIHLHTLACPDQDALQRVQTELDRLGFLLHG